MTTIIALPIPPSVNAAYRNVRGKGRVKSGRYKSWEAEATIRLMMQNPKSVGGDVRLELTFGPRDSRRDLDNMAKLPIDLLVNRGVIEDDSRIVEIVMRWDNKIAGACATIRSAA